MRTLQQITDAARRNEGVSFDELQYAVCAYDVLFASCEPTQHRPLMREFFRAAESTPRAYIGWQNDPQNPDAVAWHRSQVNIAPIIEAAKENLQES